MIRFLLLLVGSADEFSSGGSSYPRGLDSWPSQYGHCLSTWQLRDRSPREVPPKYFGTVASIEFENS